MVNNTTDTGDTNGSVAVSSYANIQVASVISNGAGFGNLAISGNTLSATNTNGDVIIDPDGTGTVQIDALEVIGGVIDGTVIGGTTAAAADFTTMDASGNATVGGTLGVTAATLLGNTLGVTGTATMAAINATDITASGTLGVTGATTMAGLTATTTQVSTLTATGNTILQGTLSTTGLATFTAGADMTGDKIVDLADPTNPQDAATMAYVDSVYAIVEIGRAHV